MSCKQRRDQIVCFLVVVLTVHLFTFQVSHSVSVGQRGEGLTAYPVQDNDAQQQQRPRRRAEQLIRSPRLRKTNQPGLPELRPGSAVFPAEPIPSTSAATLDDSSLWTIGNITAGTRSSAPDSEDGYQADFPGFHGVQGKVTGPPFDSSPHFSEWLSMRPSLQCDESVMTFTASGGEFTHLLVYRAGASPISLSQLPPLCGYSVRMSMSDLEMVVSYEACYIKKENGSYVLPMLWRGSPLKLSCPVQMSTPAPASSPSAPSVSCSPVGMAMQMQGQERDIQKMGVIVNGGWGPFVCEECAHLVPSTPGTLAFFISYDAPCITRGDGLNLQFILDDQLYTLACPVNPEPPYIPDPVSPAPTSPPPPPPPQPTTLAHFAQRPDFPHYPYVPFFYPAVTPASKSAAKKTTATATPTATTAPPATHPPKHPASPYYPPYSPQMPYYPAPTFAPVTQTPAPLIASPPSPKQPVGQKYPFVPFYYPYGTFSYRGLEVQPDSSQHPAITQPSCTMCRNYPYPYYPYYHPLYPPHYRPPYPQYAVTQPPIATTTSSPAPATAGPTPQRPHLQCLMGAMVVFLPFAHPDSIQVRDQMKTWLFVSGVSRLCGYMLQMAEGSGVILHSPLPACHSQTRTLTTISLPLRFWDLSMGQYRTLDLQCPNRTPPTAMVPPPVFPNPLSTAKVSPPDVPKHKVFCSSHHMTVELPPGPFSGVFVKDVKGNQMNLQDVPKPCGYSARKGKDDKILLSLELHSRCHMSVQGKMYIITVVYMTVNGRREAQLSCPVVALGSGQECNLPIEQRLPCGPDSVSQPQCLSMGCRFSKLPPACYYPMDECTIDRHFVFSVPASLTDPPLSPAMLVAAGNSTCKPQRVTSDYALFKIPMDGCGTRRVVAGKTVIYMVEIINKVQALSLNYGTITRDSPVRLLVECRFLPGTVLSVSYLVKTPSLGPEVQNQGMFGVQLRIAKDAQYSSYHPQYHQPLQMLLGKPLYLEVRLLNTPDPSLVLLVHFCVAYPRSGKAVWLLLYNGCPNPLDPALQHAVLSFPRPPAPQAQTRRFTISTFQFLPDGEFKDTDEEIYFMCSTEICSPRDGPCVEGCFGQ